MKFNIYTRLIAALLALALLFSFCACDEAPTEQFPSDMNWESPNLGDPNEKAIYEDTLYEDWFYEDIEVEYITYESYIYELTEVDQTITELLLAESTISEVLYQQTLFVPEEHLQDFANNSHTAQLFGDDIDVGAVAAKLSVGAGIIVLLTVCTIAAPTILPNTVSNATKTVASITMAGAAKGSAIVGSIGLAVGGTVGAASGALNEIDQTGRSTAVLGLALAIAGLIVSTVSLISAIPSGGLSTIGALEGAQLVIAGLSMAGALADATISTVDCVKTFKATDAPKVNWKNIDWNSVGISAAEQAINGASNGFLVGTLVGAVTGGVFGYLDGKCPSSVYNGTKKIGTINELDEFVDAKTGRVIGKVVRSQDVDGNSIYYVKEYVDPNSVKYIGDAPTTKLSKLNKNSTYGQLDKNGNANPNWLKDFKAARDRGVRLAWEQEKALVQRTGRGTRDWTAAEIQELLTTGKVKGYDGHHINSALFNPELADNPNNIVFYSTREHLQIGHGGNYQNATFGELIYRN